MKTNLIESNINMIKKGGVIKIYIFFNASSIFVNFPDLSVFLDGSPLHFLYASKYFSFLLRIVLIFEDDLKLYFFLSTHKLSNHQPLCVLFPLYQSTESIFFSFCPFPRLVNTYALDIFFFVILISIYFLTKLTKSREKNRIYTIIPLTETIINKTKINRIKKIIHENPHTCDLGIMNLLITSKINTTEVNLIEVRL